MNRIRELRVEKGITQVKFAQMLSTSQANISGWELEKWEPDKNALKKMSEIFGCSIDYILGYENKEKNLQSTTVPLTRIVKLRNEKHITQEELSKNIGINRSTLAMYETNKTEPNLETLIKLADYFQVSVDYLIGHDNAIMKRPYSEIAENFIKEFQELFSEERFINIAKLYKRMDFFQRDAIFTLILGYARGKNINTFDITGY